MRKCLVLDFMRFEEEKYRKGINDGLNDVEAEPALFHQWFVTPDGKPQAIVEFQDGTIKYIGCRYIKFFDNEFDFVWNKGKQLDPNVGTKYITKKWVEEIGEHDDYKKMKYQERNSYYRR